MKIITNRDDNNLNFQVQKMEVAMNSYDDLKVSLLN